MELLQEKWKAALDTDKLPPITDNYKRIITAQLLENQSKFLKEAATTTTADAANWDGIMMHLVRRMSPALIAYDVCGVQAMPSPNTTIFALRARYGNGTGPEALFDEANTAFSGAASPLHVGDDPWDATFTTGTGMATTNAENDPWASMGMTIEKVYANAVARQLRADYSNELAHDMRVIHNIDAQALLADIVSSQLVSEINREVVRTIYSVAKVGTQWKASDKGTFDLAVDVIGTNFIERVKGLVFAIERDANMVGKETRCGKGNVIITSADVASALYMVGLLSNVPVYQAQTDLSNDDSGVTFAGRMGRFKIFTDPYLGTDGYVVGYKGANPYDAGIFYCPYVPLQMVSGTDVKNGFTPAIGFKTRYAIVSNPFTSLSVGSNVYYRKTRVLNIM